VIEILIQWKERGAQLLESIKRKLAALRMLSGTTVPVEVDFSTRVERHLPDIFAVAQEYANRARITFKLTPVLELAALRMGLEKVLRVVGAHEWAHILSRELNLTQEQSERLALALEFMTDPLRSVFISTLHTRSSLDMLTRSFYDNITSLLNASRVSEAVKERYFDLAVAYRFLYNELLNTGERIGQVQELWEAGRMKQQAYAATIGHLRRKYANLLVTLVGMSAQLDELNQAVVAGLPRPGFLDLLRTYTTPFIEQVRDAAVSMFGAIRERLASLHAHLRAGMREWMIYARREALLERFREQQEALLDAFQRGQITETEYQRRMEMLGAQMREVEDISKKVENRWIARIGKIRKAVFATYVLAWRLGIVGWVVSYHVRRMMMFTTGFFRQVFRFAQRFFRWIRRLLQHVADFSTSIRQLATTISMLSIAGMLTSKRFEYMTGMVEQLLQQGPRIAGMFGMVAAVSIRAGLAIAEALPLEDILALIDRLIESPLIPFLGQLVGALTAVGVQGFSVVLASLEQFVVEYGDTLIQLLAQLTTHVMELLASAVRFAPVIFDVLQLFDRIVTSVTEMLPLLVPRLVGALHAIVDALIAALPVLPALMRAYAKSLFLTAQMLSLLGILGEEILSLVMFLNVLGPVVLSVCAALDAFLTLLQAAPYIIGNLSAALSSLAAHPVVAAIVAIGILIAILVTLYYKCEWFRNGVNAIGAAIMQAITTLKDWAIAAFNAIVSALKTLWNWLQSIAANIVSALTTLATYIQTFAGVVVSLIEKVIDIFITFRDAVLWVCDEISRALRALEDTVNNAMCGIWSAISWLINSLCLSHAFHNMYESIKRDTLEFERFIESHMTGIEAMVAHRELGLMYVPGAAAGPARTVTQNVHITFEHVTLESGLDIDELAQEIARAVGEAV